MDPKVRTFIADTFSSVWDLELLLLLKASPATALTPEALVSQLRASEAVIAKSGAAVTAAGLAIDESAGALRYAPASADLAALVEATQEVYRRKPDAVRRVIAGRAKGELDAFADAFKLRRGPPK